MSKTRAIFRKIIRIGLIAAAIFIILVSIALIMLSLSPGEEFLRGIIEDQAASALGQPVVIGKLESNIFSRLVLYDIRVIDTVAGDSMTAIAVDTVHVEYRLLPLLRKTVRIESVDIDSLAVHLRCNQSGLYNLALMNDTTVHEPEDTITAGDSGSGFTVDLSRLTLEYSTLSYDDNTMPAHVILRDGNIDVSSADPSGYRFTFHADSLDAVYDSLPVSGASFDVRGSYSADVLRIDTLALAADQFLLGMAGNLALDSAGEMSGRAAFRGQPSKLIERVVEVYELPPITVYDTISLLAEVSGTLNSPVVSGELTLPRTEIGEDEVERVYVTARWHADTVAVDSLYIKGFSGSVAGSAKMRLDTVPDILADLTLKDISVETIWSRIYGDPSPYTGRVSGDIFAEGSGIEIRGYQVSASLAMTEATYRSKPFADFTITASLSDGNGRLTVDQENIVIDASGRFDRDDLDLLMNADIDRIEPLAALANFPGLTGRVDISGSVTGSLKSPMAQADIEAYDIRYRNIPIDSLIGGIRYEDSILYLRDIRFAGRIDTLTPDNAPYDLDLTATNVDVQGEVSGPLDSLTGRVTAAFDNGQYGEYSVDAGGISASLYGMNAMIDSLWAVKGSAGIHARGDFDIDQMAGGITANIYTRDQGADEGTDSLDAAEMKSAGTIDGTFDFSDSTTMIVAASGSDVDIASVVSFVSDSLEAGGKTDFNIEFSGNVDQPHLIGSVFVVSPRYQDLTLDSILVQLMIEDTLAQVQKFSVHADGLHLNARTTVRFDADADEPFAISGDSPIRGQIETRRMELSTFSPMIPAAELNGQADIDIEWEGTVNSPHVTGHFTLDSVVVATPERTDSIYNVYLDGTLRDSVFTIDSARGILLREPFTLDGSVTVSQWERFATEANLILERIGTVALRGEMAADTLDMHADIDRMELALLSPFVTAVDSLAGRLACNVSITGSPDDPKMAGNIAVDNLAFHPVMARAPVKDGIIRVTFDTHSARIDTLSASVGGGRVVIGGTVEHDQGEITGIDLEMKADDVRMAQKDVFTVHMRSADLTYTSENEYYVLDGDVELGECRLIKNFPLQSILPWAETVERVESDLPPVIQQTRLNVRLRGSDQLWVDNNLARIRLSSDLTFVGTIPQPNFTGRVNVEEGYVLYLDRKFTVTEGILYFVDHFKFNPEVSLRAETEVKTYQALESITYKIVVSVQGQLLGDRVIELTSEPPLERPDIVSLLTLGATRKQLAGGGESEEGGAGSVLTRRAQMLTSRRVSGFVSGKVGSLLGLDRVTVEGNLFKMNEGAGPQITATKQLSDRIELTYSTTVGQMNEQSIEVGYQFWRRFYFVGQTNRAGQSSIDLKYRLRFR